MKCICPECASDVDGVSGLEADVKCPSCHHSGPLESFSVWCACSDGGRCLRGLPAKPDLGGVVSQEYFDDWARANLPVLLRNLAIERKAAEVMFERLQALQANIVRLRCAARPFLRTLPFEGETAQVLRDLLEEVEP